MKVDKTLISPKGNTKNTSFTSKGLVNSEKLRKFLEPEKLGNMSRGMFLLNAYIFLLGVRFFKSRKDGDQIAKKKLISNEQRETIIRDIPTILIAVNGVPAFQKLVAKYIHKKGFAILQDVDSKTTATVGQIEDWYKFDKNLKSGFKGFLTRLNEKGGNLKKIVSKLSDNIKDGVKGFSEDNTNFIKELLKNPKNKNIKNDIITEFSKTAKEGNQALIHASFLKSVPKIAGFLITLGLIGLGIPKLNIFITEKISKKEKAKEQDKTNPEEVKEVKPLESEKTDKKNLDIVSSIITAQNSSSNSKKNVFAYFLGK